MKKLLLLTLGMCCLGFVNAQKVDEVFQYENLKYKITAYRKVILVKDKYSGNIIVPSKVVYNNIEYSVVQIPIHTFYDCVDLKSITIPSSVTDIVGTAFSGCTGLETIIVDENNPKYYSSGNCIIERETNCLIAGCKNSVIPEGVTSISEYAFDRCGLLTINIPSSLTTIPTLAFYAPYSEFEAIIIDENNPKYYSSGNCIIDKETKTLISGCNNSIIPNGITTIGNNAFLRCYYLTSVILPNGVTTIGNSAFSSCSSLTSITIPNSLTTIGSYAFFYCSGLKSITIPNSITTIGSNAFKNCINLKKIVCLSKEVPTAENNTFSSVSPDILLVPIGSAEAYKNANVWKNFSSKIIEGYVVNGLSTNENMGYVSVLQAIVEPNKTTTLTATAANGYHFTQWSDGNTENPRTVTIVSDTAFTAEFAINVYNVTASATNGTVDGVGEYTHGSSATLTATATNGYHFTQWSDGNTENPRTVTIVSDTAFTAEFAINVYNVTASATNGTVDGVGEYTHGSSATLTATATNGYHFTQWSDGNTENPRTVTIVSDTAFTAEFAINVYNVTASATNGTVDGVGEYTHGASATLTATAANGYHFTQWSDGNTENPRTVTIVSDTAFTAEFAINVYNVTASATNGTVDGVGEYTHGASATLTATATNGYHFTQWSDGNTENPRTITVVSDTAFTAEFAINVYNVTASATNGTVIGVGDYTHGSYATLTATATNGYHFTQWSDGNTDNPRTITVVSDTIFIAEFVTNDTDKNNDNSVDINSISENTLSVYPSPASDVINIVGAENGAMVRIYNISGRMVHTSYLETSLFNVSNLPQGVYFIEVENCGRTKFVKQ